MQEILELQELPSASATEDMPLVSTLSVSSPCPGWPSSFTWSNC
uniref:LabA n=1 Tax=Actinoplanes sp. NAI112 TaxID=1433141 RepID=V9PX22_9ACTN|nr:LabA [Actinoplanes sp. NAI112]